jgi:Uma2 family endonuclease
MIEAVGEPETKMDAGSYLAFERASTDKHELWDGQVFAMGGASLAHNRIVRNVLRHLGNDLEGTDCETLPSDLRVRIGGTDRYVYPDVTIVCGPPRLEGEADILLNPRVVVEVLSPSTAAFDRGDKFAGYRSIASVREVVFIEQSARRVEVYVRQPDDTWLLRELVADGVMSLAAGPVFLSLDRIYEGVEPFRS